MIRAPIAVLHHPALRGVLLRPQASTVGRTAFARRFFGATAVRSSQEGDLEPKANTYIRNSPELDKILKDLYDDDASIPGSESSKYKPYSDDDADIIYDIDEERAMALERKPAPRKKFDFGDIELKAGVHGVFDVEELVLVLRRENCMDICVLSVPKEFGYVDQMVVVTCKSKRHLTATATFVRKLFKLKCGRSKRDPPTIEGLKEKSDWLAMDMGNIALHIMTQTCREKYDLEQLWALGIEHDGMETEKDSLDELMESHPLLADLVPIQRGPD